MDTFSPVTRRSLLAAGAGGVGVAALAACSSSGSKTDTSATAAAPATSESSTATSTPTSSNSAAPASSSSNDSGSDDSGGKDALISLDDIAVGKGASVKLANGKPAIVTRTSSSSAVCFSAICTHQGCTVAPKGAELDCPCHGSKFNLKTGAVLNGPASEPLAKVAVKVQGGKVVEG